MTDAASMLSASASLEANLACINILESDTDVSEIITDVLEWPINDDSLSEVQCVLNELARRGEARINLVMLQERVENIHVTLQAIAISLRRISSTRIWSATLNSVLNLSVLVTNDNASDEDDYCEDDDNESSKDVKVESRLSKKEVMSFLQMLLQDSMLKHINVVVNVILRFLEKESNAEIERSKSAKSAEDETEELNGKKIECGDRHECFEVAKLCLKQTPPHLLTYETNSGLAIFVEKCVSDESVWPQIYASNFMFESFISSSLAHWVNTGSFVALTATQSCLQRLHNGLKVSHDNGSKKEGVETLIEALVEVSVMNSDYRRRRFSMVLLDLLRERCCTSLAFLKTVFDQGGQRGGIDGWVLVHLKDKLIRSDHNKDENYNDNKHLAPCADMAKLIMSSQSWLYEASLMEALQGTSSIVAGLNTLFCLRRRKLWQRHFAKFGDEVLDKSRKLITRLNNEINIEVLRNAKDCQSDFDLQEARKRLDMIAFSLARFE